MNALLIVLCAIFIGIVFGRKLAQSLIPYWLRADPDETIHVSEADYLKDIAKYMELASGEHFVIIEFDDGNTMIMGRGKSRPPTPEEIESEKKFFEELLQGDHSDGPPSNSWVD